MTSFKTLAPFGFALGLAAMIGPALAQSIEPSKVVRPEGAAQHEAPVEELVAKGEELYGDTSLSGSGEVSCLTCHTGMTNYQDTFNEPYPHPVAMASQMAGLDAITAETMVQLCMVVPMGTDPLPWDSEELAALAAYVEDEQRRFAAR